MENSFLFSWIFGSESYKRFDSHRLFSTKPSAINMFPIRRMYMFLQAKMKSIYIANDMFPTISPVLFPNL